jgi:hypothetical protein
MASYPEDEDVIVWSDKPEDVYLDQLIRDQVKGNMDLF